MWKVIIIIMASLAGPTNSYRLLLFPSDIPSHVLMFTRAANLLSERGYNVTMILPSSFPVKDNETRCFSLERYQLDQDPILLTEKWQNEAVRLGVEGSFLQKMQFIFKQIEVQEYIAENTLKDADFIDRLRKQKFDFALIDLIFWTYLLPYKLSVPYAPLAYNCYLKYWPHQSVYVPGTFTGFSHRMDFIDRFFNSIYTFLEELSYFFPDYKFSEKYIKEKPLRSLGDLTASASACFVLRDHVTDFPRPMPPFAHYVGTLGKNIVKPLPRDIKTFVDGATHGLIVVSFGTWLDRLPERFLKTLLLSFVKLQQRVIMRCRLEPKPVSSENVLLLPWLPQNDLLANEKTKLVIYHGGANTLNEAAYHGVPSIVIPLIIDQQHNGQITKSKGYGEILPLSGLSVDKLVSLIHQVLNDKKVTERAREVSSILKENPMKGMDNLDYWLKYSIKHGDKYVKSEILTEMSFMCFKGYDMVAFVLVLLHSIVLIIFALWTCIPQFICPGRRKAKKE